MLDHCVTAANWVFLWCLLSENDPVVTNDIDCSQLEQSVAERHLDLVHKGYKASLSPLRQNSLLQWRYPFVRCRVLAADC